MAKIETDISGTGFKKVLENISKYKDNLYDKDNKIVSRLVSDGVDIAKKNAISLIIGEGKEEAEKDTSGIVNNNEGKIFNTSQKATYAEFGTGIVGSQNPHPNLGGWIYDVNQHGERGWRFPTTDPKLIKYTGKNGITYGFTRGNASQPFMWETAKELRRIFPKVVSRVFKEDTL